MNRIIRVMIFRGNAGDSNPDNAGKAVLKLVSYYWIVPTCRGIKGDTQRSYIRSLK
jgi:hypothetical protein